MCSTGGEGLLLVLVAAAFFSFVPTASAAEPAFTDLPSPHEIRIPPGVCRATAPKALMITTSPKTN
jgi:hypothetical protein